MRNLRFLSCLLVLLLGLPVVAQTRAETPAKAPAKTQAKAPAQHPLPPAGPQATLQEQNVQFLVPKLVQLEPLYAFDEVLEKALGTTGLHERMQRVGLHLLLLPATQAAWAQKGLALDKPLVLQTQPHAFICMGIADGKAVAAVVEALPGEEKATQKEALRYRLVRTSPEHRFILFWNSAQLCTRPQLPALEGAALLKALEKTLTEASALSKTAAKQTWPLVSAGAALRLYMEPVSAKRLKLRLEAANAPWKFTTTPGAKTTLASVSTQTGALLKLHGIPASEVFRHVDFTLAFSPKADALLPQKRAWFSRLPPLLAEEFLLKLDFPEGRNSERLLLVAKLKAGSESAFDAWLSEMPKEEAAATDAALLATPRGPLVFARKGNWAFAASRKEQALSLVEQLEKAKPETAPPLVGLVFPKTLGALLQGETFASLAAGLSPRHLRMLKFNAPLRNLFHSIHLLQVEAHPKNADVELRLDVVLDP